MINSRFYIILLIFFFFSCQSIEFVHKNKESLSNQVVNNVEYIFTGKEIPSKYRYASAYFGSVESPNYILRIDIDETKTKRSVETNQAVSKLDYVLNFKYSLEDKNKNCLLHSKSIVSKFSYVPKSSGYNYGTEKSLENLYNLTIEENFSKFVNYISNKNISNCQNES